MRLKKIVVDVSVDENKIYLNDIKDVNVEIETKSNTKYKNNVLEIFLFPQ